MNARVVALTVVVLALLAALVVTGIVPIPWLESAKGDARGGEGTAEGGPEDADAPGLAGAMGDPKKKPGAMTDDPAAPAEDVVPAEVKGTAAALGGGVVKGRVVRGEASLPVEGVTVRLLRPDSLFTYLRAKREGRHDDLVARTGADGKFTFRDVLPATSYALWGKPVTGASVTKTDLEVLAKRATDAGDLLLGPSGGLGGKVTDGAGKPIPGVKVAVAWQVVNEFEIVLADPATLPWVEAEATTDAEGVWAAKTLEPGDKTIVLRAPSGASDVLGKVTCKDGEQRTDVNAVLGGALAIGGTVTWEDGSPVAQARVYAKAVRGAAAHTMDTGADGVFRLGPLSEGSYQVAALVTGLPVRIGKIVKAGTEGMSLVFTKGGSLTGTVVSATSGKPLTRFRLTPLYTGEQDYISKFVSEKIQRVLGPIGFASADGSFRFERLQPGPYTLVVEADGYPRFEATNVRVVGGQETVAPPISVPDGHRAAGVVVDASGKPVPDVRVFLSLDVRAEDVAPEEMEIAVEEMEADAVTDDGGAFETSLLTPGVYRLGAMAKGRMPGTIERLDLRTASRGDLKVTLPPGGGISVRLVDGSGKPVVGQTAVFVHEDGFVEERRADDKGVVAMKPARTGRWSIAWLSRSLRGLLNPRAAPGATAPVVEPTPQQIYDFVRAAPGGEETSLSDGTQRDLTIRLPRLVRVKGRVRVDGRPPAGAQIGLWSGASWTGGSVDAEGRFDLQNVEPGSSHLYLQVPNEDGGSWQNRAVQVPEVVEHSVDIEFGK